MELDNLKAIWHDLEDSERSGKDDQGIMDLLQGRSRSAVSVMRRNLLIEMIAAVILYGAAIFYFLVMSFGRYNEIAILFGVVGVFSGVYYYRKYTLLARMQCVTCQVRSNLQKQLKTLEKYVRFYFVSGILLTPIAYFATGLIVLLNYPAENIVSAFRDSNEYILFVGIGIVVTVSSFFFNRWYIRKLYGQHISQLKKLLHEMEE